MAHSATFPDLARERTDLQDQPSRSVGWMAVAVTVGLVLTVVFLALSGIRPLRREVPFPPSPDAAHTAAASPSEVQPAARTNPNDNTRAVVGP